MVIETFTPPVTWGVKFPLMLVAKRWSNRINTGSRMSRKSQSWVISSTLFLTCLDDTSSYSRLSCNNWDPENARQLLTRKRKLWSLQRSALRVWERVFADCGALPVNLPGRYYFWSIYRRVEYLTQTGAIYSRVAWAMNGSVFTDRNSSLAYLKFDATQVPYCKNPTLEQHAMFHSVVRKIPGSILYVRTHFGAINIFNLKKKITRRKNRDKMIILNLDIHLTKRTQS